VCGLGSNRVLCGRPIGGCTILWKRSVKAVVHPVVHPISSDSKHLRHLLESDGLNICVYALFNQSGINRDEFMAQLCLLHVPLNQFKNAIAIIGGDFNVDLKHKSYHVNLLNDFINNHIMMLSDTLPSFDVDYT